MTNFMKLAAGLSVYNGGQYDGYVIGKVRLQLEGEIQRVESRIETEKKNYLIIVVTGYDKQCNAAGRLTVTMIKQAAAVRSEKTRLYKERKTAAFFFTEEQVNAYLEMVQDTNPIHHGKQAVVPGLMLLDFVLRRGMLIKETQEYVIRFLKPLNVGDTFVHIVKNHRNYIMSPDQRICYAEINY